MGALLTPGEESDFLAAELVERVVTVRMAGILRRIGELLENEDDIERKAVRSCRTMLRWPHLLYHRKRGNRDCEELELKRKPQCQHVSTTLKLTQHWLKEYKTSVTPGEAQDRHGTKNTDKKGKEERLMEE